MGWTDFAKHLIPGEPLYGALTAKGPGAPNMPRFPRIDPRADAALALTAAEHQREVRTMAYSFSDLILTGGKPGYKSPLGA